MSDSIKVIEMGNHRYQLASGKKIVLTREEIENGEYTVVANVEELVAPDPEPEPERVLPEPGVDSWAAQRADAQTQAVTHKQNTIEEFRSQTQEKPKAPVATPAMGDAVEEWGPYDDYRLVPTPDGEHGVPFRKVLFFKTVQEFDNRAKQMVWIEKPFYRDATPDELAPILAKRERRKEMREAAKVR